MLEKVDYKREKIGIRRTIPGSDRFSVDYDAWRDKLYADLSAYILARERSVQPITVAIPRPTFLDWLLRRRRTTQVDIDVMAVMGNPPKLHENETLFIQQSPF